MIVCGFVAVLCYALSTLAVFKMAFGGSVTLAHTLPLIILSFWRGSKAGAKSALIFIFMKLLFNFHAPPSQTIISYVGVMILDYILPYFLMGISSLYSRFCKREYNNIVISIILTEVIRFTFSVFSGMLIWNDYFRNDIKFFAYCCLYNLTYMIPNLIISLVAIRLIYKDLKYVESKLSHTF